jgi:hypothetical protein
MRILLITYFSSCLFACVDQIDLAVQGGLEEGIFVQSELIKGTPSVLEVRISNLYNFELASLARVKAKSVKLVSEDGTAIAIPFVREGLHRYVFNEASSPIQPDFGQSFKIEIETDQDIHIESTYETLLPKPSPGILSARVDTNLITSQREEIETVSVVKFFVDTEISIPTADENALLFWMAERTYEVTDSMDVPNFRSKTCYITVNLDFDDIHLLNGRELTQDTIDNFELTTVRLNFEFAEGYYYTVYQRSLTPGAFEYYSRIKETIERTGNLFDPAVGRIPSNLSNIDDASDSNIYGYFTTFAQDTIRLYVDPKTVGNPNKRCPQDIRCDPPRLCCDCLVEEGSTTTKPYFWEE